MSERLTAKQRNALEALGVLAQAAGRIAQRMAEWDMARAEAALSLCAGLIDVAEESWTPGAEPAPTHVYARELGLALQRERLLRSEMEGLLEMLRRTALERDAAAAERDARPSCPAACGHRCAVCAPEVQP